MDYLAALNWTEIIVITVFGTAYGFILALIGYGYWNERTRKSHKLPTKAAALRRAAWVTAGCGVLVFVALILIGPKG